MRYLVRKGGDGVRHRVCWGDGGDQGLSLVGLLDNLQYYRQKILLQLVIPLLAVWRGEPTEEEDHYFGGTEIIESKKWKEGHKPPINAGLILIVTAQVSQTSSSSNRIISFVFVTFSKNFTVS